MAHVYFALFILAASPSAQTERAPMEADEIFVCDFQEASDRNHDGWPDNWTRRRSQGYPAYLPVEIVADSQSDQTSPRCLRIQLDGGAALLHTPSIAIVPQFSYRLTARIRARGLKHDVASCSVSFYSAADKLLETHESPLFQNSEDWLELRVGPITPASDDVRSAIVTVHVRPTDKADLLGEVFLDDLWLGRLPKMSLILNGENGVFTDPKAVRVTCSISGFKNESPTIKFALLDVYGKKLHESALAMEGATESPSANTPRDRAVESLRSGFSGKMTWQPPIKEAGYYSVRVSTPGSTGLEMTEIASFVVMPPLLRGKVGEFGWSLPDVDRPLPIRMLPSLLNETGVHWVKCPVWFGAHETKRAEEIAWFAERLSSFHIQMVGLLDQPPLEVRDAFGIGPKIPIATAMADRAIWHPALDPVMTRLSLKVRWWQLGRDDDTSFASDPNLTEKLQGIRDELSAFGQRVNVGVPFRAIQERHETVPISWAFFSLVDGLPFTDQEIKSYLGSAPKDQAKRWITLQPLSRQNYDLDARARDLVRRMLAAKVTGADAIFVPEPFNSDHGLMQTNGSPGELLLPWRTAAMLVGGSEYIGGIKLPQESENYIFANDQDAVLVLWNDQPVTEKIYLGEKIRQYDLWGRESQPVSTTDGDGPYQEIKVGPLPTFLAGVNAGLAKWRMGFQFKNARLASIFGREQIVAYHVRNSFPQGVGGTIKFHLPPEWKSSEVERVFQVAQGASLEDSLSIQLGAEATSGKQPIKIDFDLTADRNYKFTIYETIHVGLGDIDVQLETHLDENGNLVVDQHLTNNTDELVSFKCFVYAPGRRRERQLVFNLARGSTLNSFVLPHGRELIGQTLWFRAEEVDGVRIMNDHIVAME